MNLFLSQITDRHWKGLVEIDQETFKVTLFPGSATTDWEAVLEVGGWVELSDDSKLTQAVRDAYTSWQRLEQPIPPSQEQLILEALEEHPELLDAILTAISMKETSEDLVK